MKPSPHRTRNLLIVASGLSLFLAVPLQAQPFGGAGGTRPVERQRMILELFDENGDGQLDSAEREAAREEIANRRAAAGIEGAPGMGRRMTPEQRDRLIQRFDANDDGVLDEAERAEVRETMRANRPGGGGPGMRNGPPRERPLPPEVRAQIRRNFDADGDGVLSPEERQKARETMRPLHQQNAAGGMRPGDPANGRPGPGPRQRDPLQQALIERFDTDGDGWLSPQERQAASEAVRGADQSPNR